MFLCGCFLSILVYANGQTSDPPNWSTSTTESWGTTESWSTTTRWESTTHRICDGREIIQCTSCFDYDICLPGLSYPSEARACSPDTPYCKKSSWGSDTCSSTIDPYNVYCYEMSSEIPSSTSSTTNSDPPYFTTSEHSSKSTNESPSETTSEPTVVPTLKPNQKFYCIGEPDMYPDPFNCYKSYYCYTSVEGTKLVNEYFCPPTMYYNSTARQCEVQMEASQCYTTTCSNEQTQIWSPDPQFWITCNDEEIFMNRCPHFETYVQGVGCQFECTEEGRFEHENQFQYYFCYFSGFDLVYRIQKCPGGYTFNPITRRCNLN